MSREVNLIALSALVASATSCSSAIQVDEAVGTRKSALETEGSAPSATRANADPSANDCAQGFGSGADSLIDNFEDGDRWIRPVEARHGHWWVGGHETCHFGLGAPTYEAPPSGNASSYALHVIVDACAGWGFITGYLLKLASFEKGDNYNPEICPYDASYYDGVYFWARSTNADTPVRFIISTMQTQPGRDGTCESADGCYNDHGVALELTSKWTRYAFRWNDLAQIPGWGMPIEFRPTELLGFGWVGHSGAYDFWLDQVGFFKGEPASNAP